MPARTSRKASGGRAGPGFGPLQTQAPHSAQVHRVSAPAARRNGRGSGPARRKASPSGRSVSANAPPVRCRQAVQRQVWTAFGTLVIP